jgi:hypothetical protein
VSFEAPEMPMLYEHQTWPGPIGRWSGMTVDASGITAAPNVYRPVDDHEREMPIFQQSAQVAALMDRKHPWQASIKITGALEDYERVLPGQPVAVNGRTELASDDVDDPPLFILRRGVASEASVCLFGADADTGALAASRTNHPTTPESSMERLKVLLARHGEKHAARIAVALSAGQTDDQIAASLSAAAESDHAAALAAVNTELATTKAALAAANTQIAALNTKLAALAPADDKAAGDAETPPATEGESKNGAPKSVHEGMAQLSREGSKLTGFPLRSAVLKRWPTLRSTLPKA